MLATEAGEAATLRGNGPPKWGRRHPQLFGAPAASALGKEEKPSTATETGAVSRGGGGGGSVRGRDGGGGFSKLELFEAGPIRDSAHTQNHNQNKNKNKRGVRGGAGGATGAAANAAAAAAAAEASDTDTTTVDIDDEDDHDDENDVRRRRRHTESDGGPTTTLSKAARAHAKLKQQQGQRERFVVEEAQRHHKHSAMLHRQMWDVGAGGDDQIGDAGDGSGIDADTGGRRSFAPRHSAPPSAIFSPSPKRGRSRRASHSQSQRGGMGRCQSQRGSEDRDEGSKTAAAIAANNGVMSHEYSNTENDDPNVGSPSMGQIWATMQRCPSSKTANQNAGVENAAAKLGSFVDRDPIRRPTPTKKGSVLAPLPVTPEPPTSQQEPRQGDVSTMHPGDLPSLAPMTQGDTHPVDPCTSGC